MSTLELQFTPGDPLRLGEGIALLRGYSRSIDLMPIIERIAARAPFRHLVTPGGQTMSVAMTNCGPLGWVSDRSGYRYSPRDPVTGEPDPSAHLRLYRDARQVEATHCYIGRRWQDVIGMYPPPEAVIGHRLRMNTFLGKWLHYLAERGHGVATLAGPASDDAKIADCA